MVNEQLLQIEVLDQHRIKELKERINVRYETSTSKQKATILAQAIHTIIDNSLPNFSTETKRSIRMELMNKKLAANSLSISANDIIESSIELATQEELEKELSQWLLKKIDTDLNNVEIYLDNLLQRRQNVENEIACSTELEKQPIIHQVDGSNLITNDFTIKNILQKYKAFFVGATAIILASFFIILSLEYPEQKSIENASAGKVESKINEIKPNELPSYLQYENIDEKKLREWLNGRDSMLADEPYFSSIIKVADEFNIHPLLLFAITGQEQGFVPKNQKNAEKIANNPFNVYHSWEEYNTNISESSQIAARTIVNVSKNRPKEVDPIQWINRKYAEDQNWWRGGIIHF